MRTVPSFPNSIWAGDTGNREGPNDDINPNSEDWDRIRDEVVAVQEYIQQEYLVGTAIEDIPHSRLVQSGIRLASPSEPNIIGISLNAASAFDTVRYAPSGTVLSLGLSEGVYFLAANGGLSLFPPNNGYSVKVGLSDGELFYFRVHDSVRL